MDVGLPQLKSVFGPILTHNYPFILVAIHCRTKLPLQLDIFTEEAITVLDFLNFLSRK